MARLPEQIDFASVTGDREHECPSDEPVCICRQCRRCRSGKKRSQG